MDHLLFYTKDKKRVRHALREAGLGSRRHRHRSAYRLLKPQSMWCICGRGCSLS
jgi:hypothetical protein